MHNDKYYLKIPLSVPLLFYYLVTYFDQDLVWFLLIFFFFFFIHNQNKIYIVA